MDETESHDTDIALIKNDMIYLRESMKEIHDVLTKNGLITTVALTKQSVKRLWWWVGGVSLTSVSVVGGGLFYFLIRSAQI